MMISEMGGYNGVYDFYKNHFIGKTTNDLNITRLSRTVGKDQVVDEFILSFTHNIEFEYLLPGVPPTGKYVEIPHVAVVKFKHNKISFSNQKISRVIKKGLKGA